MQSSLALEEPQCRRSYLDSIMLLEKRLQCQDFAGRNSRIEDVSELATDRDIAVTGGSSGGGKCQRLHGGAGKPAKCRELARLDKRYDRNRICCCCRSEGCPRQREIVKDHRVSRWEYLSSGHPDSRVFGAVSQEPEGQGHGLLGSIIVDEDRG
jgi:hypothetical protein